MKINQHIQLYIILSTIMILWARIFHIFWLPAYWQDNIIESDGSNKISVSVKITNDFVWYIKRWWSTDKQFFTWSIWYTNTPDIYVKVWADKNSTYKLSGDITWIWTGGWVWSYNLAQFTTLTPEDGIKYIYSDYTNIWGIYHTWVVKAWLDRTGPSKPQISFIDGTVINNNFDILWTGGNIDTWVWFEKYILHIALDPNFVSEVKTDLYKDKYTINTSHLPLGTIRRYIESVDYLGNSTPSNVHYFHNALPSIPNWIGYTTEELDMYYHWSADSDRPIQDTPITPQRLQNIFDVMVKVADWKKIIYNEEDLKQVLIYNYLTHHISDTRLLPKWVPKSGVDSISRYTEQLAKKVNTYISTPTNKLRRDDKTIGIGLILFAIGISIILIVKERRSSIHDGCS